MRDVTDPAAPLPAGTLATMAVEFDPDRESAMLIRTWQGFVASYQGRRCTASVSRPYVTTRLVMTAYDEPAPPPPPVPAFRAWWP